MPSVDTDGLIELGVEFGDYKSFDCLLIRSVIEGNMFETLVAKG
jgi:hypothetical protein